ncbi:MAG: methyltransferase domain-containing protein [Candidatus Micrarchaeota archaeon]
MARHAFYKLVEGTIELDGVRMHQTKRLSPCEAARLMVSQLQLRRGERVLDVCTGLGYTALEEARLGAVVTTVEVDGEVLSLAKQNNASKALFNNPAIKIIEGDAVEVVALRSNVSFDAVMLDPPRFSLAGELYSLAFYRSLYRALRPGGRLFHYTGKPGEKSGKDYRKGIKQRLLEAGFTRVEWVDGALGFKAVKTAGRLR